jgi:hypothetical protein
LLSGDPRNTAIRLADLNTIYACYMRVQLLRQVSCKFMMGSQLQSIVIEISNMEIEFVDCIRDKFIDSDLEQNNSFYVY